MRKSRQTISAEQLKQFSRQIAVQQIKEIAKLSPINITVKEFLRMRHKGLM